MNNPNLQIAVMEAYLFLSRPEYSDAIRAQGLWENWLRSRDSYYANELLEMASIEGFQAQS